ncbi:phage tail protein [Herbaspirillum sp. NPDC087042]|uniref:phage tail protein n=1 Tax=Herbaspirillum sp. NPDC087042 TaxID=3364004 RepID=UPI003819B967
MQVLERTGEDRDKRAARDAGSDAHAHPDKEESSMADEALEIRASHITAAAVAAAAVTAAVVTGGNAPAVVQEGQVAQTAPEPQAQPQLQPSPVLQRSAADAPAVAAAPSASTRGALLVSLLTLGVIGLALWLSAQWPQRGLKPMLQHLPGLSQVTSEPASQAPVPAVAALDQAPDADTIALLQQEADEKARLLAHKRAAAEARHRREDEALALREQRRREAEAQLADARAKAERAQAAALAAPEIVEVPAAPSLAEQLKQCRALSLFARESCLWKLCDGKWGKDGCPSYEHSNEGA